jgi:hypothetical protein
MMIIFVVGTVLTFPVLFPVNGLSSLIFAN